MTASIDHAYRPLGPVRLRSCPLPPLPRQERSLRLPVREAFFGGAAGGGKSICLLMAALQYVDVPGYSGLLLRPSLRQFQLPGGMMELAHHWLAGTPAVWNGELHQWRFPGSGKTG